MKTEQNEEKQLRSVALKNAQSILQARQRAEEDLSAAKESLERKTQQLAASVAVLEATLESTTDGILVTDAAGKVLRTNRKYLEILRLSPEQVHGKSHRDVLGLIAAKVADPQKFRARVEEIYAAAPEESFDIVELDNGTTLERFSKVQRIDGQNAGRVWSFRDVSRYRHAEEELRQQREWFEVTLSSIGDSVITTDNEGQVTFLNPTATDLTGWDLNEAVGQPLDTVFRIINERTREPAPNPIHEVLRTGRIVTLANHTCLITRSGAEIAIEDSAAPIRGPAGGISGAVMVFHDVTARRRAEEARRQSEERFRVIFDRAAIGIVVTDLDGSLVEMNEKFAGMLCYSVGDLKKLRLHDITHQDDLPELEARLQNLTGGRIADFSIEKRCLRKDGSLIWTLTNVALLTDPEGTPRRFIGVVEDITARKQLEEAHTRLAAVVESSDDAIVSIDLDTIIHTWNAGAERMLGYRAAEIIGKSVTILLPPENVDEEQAILDKLTRGERIEHYETIRVRKDGVRLNISLSVSPILNAAGKIIGASKIARDITEKKRAEADLREAQEKLRQHASQLEKQVAERTAHLRETIAELESFSYSISHDMRSPLRAMQGYADALLEDYEPQLDETAKTHLRRICRAASRLDLLIQDVLAYSRVAKGDIRLQKVDLEEVIREVIHNFPALQPPKARTTVKPLPLVLGHEGYLTQIVSNLLGNAVKFVSRGTVPEITIRSEVEGELVRIWFEDNGIGIAPEHYERIFQIFGRVYSEKVFEGTGIGLAVAKKAAERLGGSLGVVSELGKGSRFFLILRRAP
jgi:PAS domain S-box-containing protein